MTPASFAFSLSLGDFHGPHFVDVNPCRELGDDTTPRSAGGARQRASTGSAEFEDVMRMFEGANIFICADHGDAWGKDGLWSHGFHHQKVLE